MQTVETLNEGLKRAYTLTIPARDIAAKVDAEVRKAAPQVRMPGFRPGKVPANLVRKMHGPALEQDARREALKDRTEQLKPRLAEEDKAAQEVKGQAARQQVDLQNKAATIEQQLKALEAERAQLTTGVDEELLDQYERLFTNKTGAAVVGLEHDTCTGCHMKVTASTAARTKGGREVVECEQCGRLLYWSPN